MNKLLVLVCISLLASVQSQAQYRKMIHQTFDTDSVDQVVLQLVGDLTIETWPGNMIMTETTINIFDASSALIKHMMEAGRYAAESEQPDESLILTISSKDKEREEIKVRRKVGGKIEERTVYELVDIHVFIPEDFSFMNKEKTHWERIPEILDEGDAARLHKKEQQPKVSVP